MTHTDQIAAALGWINENFPSGGADIPNALKALAAGYERQRQEIERLKRIVEEVKSINAEYVDAISTSKTAMSRIGGLFEND